MTSILKVSLSFAGFSSADLLVFTNGVLAGFLTNAEYPSPTPNFAAMVLLRDDFNTAVVNAQYGGTHLNNIKRDKRKLLIDALRMWAHYVNMNNYNYNRTIMETTRFSINGGPRPSRGIPDDITGLKIKQGKLKGTAKVTINVVSNADYYIIRYAVIALDGSIGEWVELPASTSSRMLITGFPTGHKIRMQICAGNSHGLGNWSVSVDSDFLN